MDGNSAENLARLILPYRARIRCSASTTKVSSRSSCASQAAKFIGAEPSETNARTAAGEARSGSLRLRPSLTSAAVAPYCLKSATISCRPSVFPNAILSRTCAESFMAYPSCGEYSRSKSQAGKSTVRTGNDKPRNVQSSGAGNFGRLRALTLGKALFPTSARNLRNQVCRRRPFCCLRNARGHDRRFHRPGMRLWPKLFRRRP